MRIDSNAPRQYKAILGRTGDLTYQVPMIDLSSHVLETIDYAHHEIHAGASYTAYYSLTTAATDAHRTGIYIKTPTAKEIHMIVSFSASTAATYMICESPTIAANTGTDGVAIYNRDRNSSNTSTVTTAAANTHHILIDWYEHTKREA